MSEIDVDDVNAPSATQLALKRVEQLIRRRVSPELLLDLDNVCIIKDTALRQKMLAQLTEKMKER